MREFIIPQFHRLKLGVNAEGELLLDAKGLPLIGEECRYHSDFLVVIWLWWAWPCLQWHPVNTLTGRKM